jgi:hypothetical protein
MVVVSLYLLWHAVVRKRAEHSHRAAFPLACWTLVYEVINSITLAESLTASLKTAEML